MDPHYGAPQLDMMIGQTVGNYLVTQKLGEGGMGSVYLAEHPTIGKKVALKVLHSEFSSNQEVAARFFNEAKAVNDIGHPNIVDIVDFGIIQAGPGREQLVYFIMEYLAGNTLTRLIQTEAPLPPERALGIALQIADALSASHKCGIVHRDLKPDNVILMQRHRERDFVKLLDFGIAKLTTDSGNSRRTRTGIVMGTPAYMSPEQCEGRGNIDHRTDVYALGILLYEMLVKRVPFVGDGYGEILVQHLTQAPTPPSKFHMMNMHVEAVVMKALEKRPELRYPTMDEMMRAMSDPIGYVEANGGVQGFKQRQLMPSNAPLPTVRLGPPAGATGIGSTPTPPPGYMTTPVPAVPTTLGAATGEVAAPRRSKVGFLIAGLLVVAGAAAAVVVVLNDSPTDVAASDPKDPKDPNNHVASGTDPGSAELVGSAAGSSELVATGSGSAGSSAVGLAEGSAGSAIGPGSGEQAGSGSAKTVPPVEPTIKKPELAKIKLTTTPPGARILVNGNEIPQRTPQSFELPISKKPVKITLKLDKHEELTIPAFAIGSNFEHSYTLKKKRTAGTGTHVPKGSGGKGSGGKGSAGKGSNTGTGNDTGLLKPGDF